MLNDNTHVTSIWSEVADWVATEWFMKMSAAGCKFMGWVNSPNIYSKFYADEALKYGTRNIITIAFQNNDTATSWLKAM